MCVSMSSRPAERTVLPAYPFGTVGRAYWGMTSPNRLMRTGTAAFVAALVATTLAIASPAAAAPSGSDLTITVRWAPGVTSTWTLRCDPVGGSHPNRRRACAALDGLAKPFAPPPDDVACTMVYGGPERARVVGRWHGRAVDTRFARTNGCEIARWQQYRALLTDPGTVTVRGRVDLGPTCPVEGTGETCEIIGATATVTASSGTRRVTAPSGPEGFLLRLPRGVWEVTADAGMRCAVVTVDVRVGHRPGLVVVSCDTGIRR